MYLKDDQVLKGLQHIKSIGRLVTNSVWQYQESVWFHKMLGSSSPPGGTYPL